MMNVKRLQKLVDEAIVCESEFGELSSANWRVLLTGLGKVESFEGMDKTSLSNLVKMCSKYLESVLTDSML